MAIGSGSNVTIANALATKALATACGKYAYAADDLYGALPPGTQHLVEPYAGMAGYKTQWLQKTKRDLFRETPYSGKGLFRETPYFEQRLILGRVILSNALF
eukprot:COSAG03_NODE_1290_length_4394_cov_16.477998_4_plen_102_part_00